MENTENREIDVVELVADLNGTSMNKSQVIEKYGMKDGKRKRFLKNNGYEYRSLPLRWIIKSREFRPVVTRETDGIRLYAYTKQ